MTNEEAVKQLLDAEHCLAGHGDLWDVDMEAFEMAVKALEQTKWILVSERPPKEDGDYLVTTKWKGSYSGDVYTETHMAAYRVKSKEWDCVGVVAWMPLPSSYQGE